MQLLPLYILFSPVTAAPGWTLLEGLKVFSKTLFIFSICFLHKVMTFQSAWVWGSQLPFEDSRMLKESLQIQPTLHIGINLQLPNLHSKNTGFGSELWIQHYWETVGQGESLSSSACALLLERGEGTQQNQQSLSWHVKTRENCHFDLQLSLWCRASI